MKEVFEQEGNFGIFLVGGRYKVTPTKSVSIQLANGLIFGTNFSEPKEVFEVFVEQVKAYTVTKDRIITTLAEAFNNFQEAQEAYLRTSNKFLYATVEVKIQALSQHTWLQRKRRSDGDFKFNSYITCIDGGKKFLDLFCPIDLICKLANVKKESFQNEATYREAKDDATENLMDFVLDEQTFDLVYSVKMSKQEGIPENEKDPPNMFICARDLKPIF